MRREDLCHDVRQRLVRLPAPFAAHYGVVPPPLPEQAIPLGRSVKRVEDAMSALAQVKALAADLKDSYLISRILTRREAVASSSIEGTHSTLDELLVTEETHDEGRSSAVHQVRNYALALDDLVPQARKLGPNVMSRDLLAELHQRVMKDDPDYKDIPGQTRNRVVWIGGTGDIAYSTYNPPPPDHVEACIHDVIDYMHGHGMQAMTQGFLTRLALAHAQFEAIHPFRDGNGRVGRLMIPLMMAAEGHPPLYLSPYIEANKATYYEALKSAQQKLQWDGLVGFFADAVTGTVKELMATKDALDRLQEAWAERRDFRRDSASYRALEVLPHYPVLTVNRLSEMLGVSFKAAGAAIDQLVGAGILTERTGYARNRVFAAPEALSIINRPFGAEPIIPASEYAAKDAIRIDAPPNAHPPLRIDPALKDAAYRKLAGMDNEQLAATLSATKAAMAAAKSKIERFELGIGIRTLEQTMWSRGLVTGQPPRPRSRESHER
jgi:Fic family protein